MISTQTNPGTEPAQRETPPSVWTEPDISFIRTIRESGQDSFKKCFQCGTCSATCDISPQRAPFPRKEMLWASWGQKNRLLHDPDIWLCHQCHDCSTKCPRGARPGDLLAAVRQETIIHYAEPGFLGRWVNQPQAIPLLLGFPALLLGLLLLLKNPLEKFFGLAGPAGEKIVFANSNLLPHWLLNSFFLLFTVMAVVVLVRGVRRFWRGLIEFHGPAGAKPPAAVLLRCLLAVLKKSLTHDEFSRCTSAYPRFLSHFCLVFGFIALGLVSFWVVTARYNPLIPGDFVYPLNVFNPLKIMANLGGLALLYGCLRLIRERLLTTKQPADSVSMYADWALLVTLLAVGATGFISEILHYARIVPLRHIVYFSHLVFVFALLIYLPYSKFAHFIYRTTAMTYAEFAGRSRETLPDQGRGGKNEN
jgi:quinone-modifying oxidoreductase subunit QmoC